MFIGLITWFTIIVVVGMVLTLGPYLLILPALTDLGILLLKHRLTGIWF